jgi:alpha-tubulin suppressor-like RCC1 family protein
MKTTYTFLTLLLAGLSLHAQDIAGGGWHSAAICSGSVPSSWGRNDFGQLGHGTGADKITPTLISGLSGITAVSLGNSFSLFLKSDGTVWSCGNNANGQLGDGTNFARLSPVQVSSLTGIVAISAGEKHSLFLKNDGTVWACGDNAQGQLGDSSLTDRYTAVKVKVVSGITAVSAGNLHSLYLKSDGTVWGCGNNGMGELGTGDNANRIKPVQSPSLTGISKISAGKRYFSIFLKSNGTVWATGDNPSGQLGDGTTTQQWDPVAVSSLTGITDIATGWQHSVFLKNDGTVWTCGSNYWGQLGIGLVDPNPHATPVQMNGVSGIVKIGAGDHHSLLIKNDGTAWACGDNGNGQLGDGTNASRTSATQVGDFCATSSLDEIQSANAVAVFPNPCHGVLTLRAGAKFSRVEVLSVTGQILFSTEVNSEMTGIDLGSFAKGIYFYRISGGEQNIAIGKIVVD